MSVDFPSPNRRVATRLWLLLVAVALVGCQTAPRDYMGEAQQAFDAGEYRKAYKNAVLVVHYNTVSPNADAAYLAGVSAYRLKNYFDAERYLKIAAEAPDRQLAGQALAMLGLLYADREDYHNASLTMVKAAEKMDGQDRANAYFYAARSELRLSRWANARTYLTLAREHSKDDIFRLRASALLGATGFTLQIGVYDDEDRARQVAEHLAINARALKIGLPRVLRVVQTDGSVRHHVQIGQFSRYDTAAEKRRALGYNNAVVVLMNTAGEE